MDSPIDMPQIQVEENQNSEKGHLVFINGVPIRFAYAVVIVRPNDDAKVLQLNFHEDLQSLIGGLNQ